jgi:hypothetical protein
VSEVGHERRWMAARGLQLRRLAELVEKVMNLFDGQDTLGYGRPLANDLVQDAEEKRNWSAEDRLYAKRKEDGLT